LHTQRRNSARRDLRPATGERHGSDPGSVRIRSSHSRQSRGDRPTQEGPPLRTNSTRFSGQRGARPGFLGPSSPRSPRTAAERS
jgi:hypothetical protein